MAKPNLSPNEDNNGQSLGTQARAWSTGYVTSVTDNPKSIINKAYLENYVSEFGGGTTLKKYTIATAQWTLQSEVYETTFQKPESETFFAVTDSSGNRVFCDVSETTTAITLKSIAPFNGVLQMISTNSSGVSAQTLSDLPEGISYETVLSMILPVESTASYDLAIQPETEYTAPADGWVRFEVSNTTTVDYILTTKSRGCFIESTFVPAGTTIYKTIPVGKSAMFSVSISNGSGSLTTIPDGMTISTKYFYSRGTDPNE